MRERMRGLMMIGLATPVFALAQATTGSPSVPAPAEESSAAGITSQGIPEPSRELSSGGANATNSEAGVDTATLPSPTDRLKPVVTNDITYLCGGIGEEETNFMKQEAKGYDLMLTFAARDGAYLADVNVTISGPNGASLLQARCDSPILLVDLPKSGSYRVTADAAGHSLQRQVKVDAKRKGSRHLTQAVLVWPQQVAEAPAGPVTSGESGSAQGNTGTGTK
ncbi:hypothetical protein ACFQUU_08420 [Herbaspirillum sp. GCM10030257]|uniref:hypothetical protein n=1 Tax=Herbaspirillum sp. GCM10030257 TaxID=3273393 RepID=UPI00360964D6